jgi:thiol-disulfide isomerase/thioredoxin
LSRYEKVSRNEFGVHFVENGVVGLLLATLIACDSGDVKGVVLDETGVPVVGATVGTTFDFVAKPVGNQLKVQVGYGQPGVVTNESGRFSIPKDQCYNGALVASSKTGSAGFQTIPNSDKPCYITLHSTRTITASVIDKRKKKIEGVAFQLKFGNSVLGYGSLQVGETQLVVPKGEVSLAAFEGSSLSVFAKLNGKINEVVSLNMNPTKWAKNIGNNAPELLRSEVFPAKSAIRWKDLRGKWVLVDFWATWCMPCVAEMNEYIKFYRDHTEQRSRFEIIGVHSPDAKSYAAALPAMMKLKKTQWGGQIPPYPLVFDSSGKTHTLWGIEAYPTTLLVSPQGKLVGAGSLQDLEQALAGKR